MIQKQSDKFEHTRAHHWWMMIFLLLSILTGTFGVLFFIFNYSFQNPPFGSMIVIFHILAGPAFAYFLVRTIVRSRIMNRVRISHLESHASEVEKNAEEIISVYQALFNSIPDLIRITDKNNSVVTANPAYCELMSQIDDENAATKDDIFDDQIEKDRRRLNNPAPAIINIKRKGAKSDDVAEQYFDLIVTPVFNKQNEIIATAAVARDITELKKALDKQQKNIKRFEMLTEAYRELIGFSSMDDIFELSGRLIETLLDNPMMLVSVYDENEGVVRVRSARGFGANEGALYHLAGVNINAAHYSVASIPEDLISTFASAKLELLPGGIYDLACRQLPEEMCRTLETTLGAKYIYTIGLRKQGGYYGNVSLLLGHPIDEEDTNVLEAIMTLASIVATRNEKIERIRESESRYRYLITSSPVMGYTLDSSMNISFCTDYLLARTGYKADEMVNQPIKDFLTPSSGEYFENYIFKKISEEGVCNGDELEWIKADGSIMTTLHNAISNSYDEGGKQTIEILSDISLRKKAEAGLKHSENRYRCLVQQAKAGIAEVSHDHKIQFANDELARILDCERSELAGKDILDFFIDDEWRQAAVNFNKMKSETVYNLTAKIRLFSGENCYILVSSTPITDETGNLSSIILYVSDVTEKEIARREVKKREEFFRALYEQSPMPYHALDINGFIIDVNKSWLDAFGYEKKDVTGRPLSDFFVDFTKEQFEENIRNTVKEGSAKNLERKIRHGSGAIRNVIINAKVVYDDDGKFIQSHSIVNDITEQKAAEEEMNKFHETLEFRIKERTESLQEANSELDSFAYSISHDLRTPIRHISGFLELMQMKKGVLDEKTKESYMQIIFESAHKMGTMVEDLLLFSKMSRTEMHKKEINMNLMFKTVFDELVAMTNEKNIQFELGSLPDVTADISMIRLAITNLLSNAIKYSRHVLEAKISVFAEVNEAKRENTYHIEDNGAGFDMQYYGKLFGVFQRLHSQSEFEGTGIGLANSKRIISRHGGKIWALSNPGEGARFSFSLPF